MRTPWLPVALATAASCAGAGSGTSRMAAAPGPGPGAPSGPTPPTTGAPPGPPTPPAPPEDPAADERFLAEFVATRGYSSGRPVGAQPTPDGRRVVFLRAAADDPAHALWVFDVATAEARELLSARTLLAGGDEQLSPEERARRERARNKLSGFAGFALAPDGEWLLTSLSGRVYRVALADGKAVELAGPDAAGAAPFDARVSRDGARVGFVRGGELWVVPAAGGKPVQLTRGAKGAIAHAQAEYIAQEELGRREGWWFSPDAARVVYQITDATGVETIQLVDPFDPFSAPNTWPYPRPGKKNVDVKLAITATDGKNKRPLAVDWDRARYPYLARVRWDAGAPLTLVVMTRDQKDVAVLAVDERTGKSRELLVEHDDVFVNLHNAYRWLPDAAKGFLWASERGGAWQLEHRAADGTLVRTLTPVELGFQSLAWVAPAGERVVVHAAPDPVDARLFEIDLATGAVTPVALPAGADAPSVSAAYGKDVPVRALTLTRSDAGERTLILRADGSVAGELPDVAKPPPVAVRPEIVKVGAQGGLWAAILRPRDFDPRKKYPVLVNVYAGPHGRMVYRSPSRYVMQQWYADHGFIVVAIDGRGTPGRGRAFERAIRDHFFDVPLDDQVAGLQALAVHEPAIDLGRVGIYGASFGGYMAAIAVMRRPDVFKAAVAVAPVTDWLDYDTGYTERYLGVPDLAADGGTEIYDENGLLPYAASLTRPLLIVHGTADDNVHFRHALELADALLRAGKRFELVPLARQMHSPRDPKLVGPYHRRVFDFFRETL